MHFLHGSRAALSLVLILAADALSAKPTIVRGPDYSVRVAAIESVAIVPLDCPGTLDCASSERELVEYLRGKQKLKVVGSARLSQMLFERGIEAADLLDPDTGTAFLKELAVSALVIPRVVDYRRVDKYMGGGPGVELRGELELLVPGAPPLAKGNDTDGGPDMQFAGKSPLGRILIRVAGAVFGDPK